MNASSSSAVAKCVHTPASSIRSSAATASTSADASPGSRRPSLPHARVVLDVDARDRRPAHPRRRRGARATRRARSTISAPASRAWPISSPATEPITRIRRVGDLRAKGDRLAGRRDRQHRGATLERRPGALSHSVAVGVRLHHRAHRGARLQHCRRGARRSARSRPGRCGRRRASRAEPRGERVDHVARDHRLGRADPLRGRDARHSCSPRRRRRPPRTGSRPWARSAPIVPARTSPVPAVASAGAETTLTATGPPGAATIVSSPLSTTTQPPRSAASRAHARRCAPISSESLLEQPPELARVRGDHRGLGAARRGSRAHPRGRSGRRRRATSGSPALRRRPSRATAERGVRAAEPGPEHKRPRPSRTRPGSRPRRPSANAPSAEAHPRLITSVSFASKIGSSSPGTATVAYPAPARIAALAERHDRAREAARAAGDDDLAGRELGRVRPAPRKASPARARVIAPPGGSEPASAGMPMSATRSSPVERLPGATR